MTINDKAEAEVGDLLEHVNDVMFGTQFDTGICIVKDCEGTVDPLEPDASKVECPECGKNSVYAISQLLIMGVLR